MWRTFARTGQTCRATVEKAVTASQYLNQACASCGYFILICVILLPYSPFILLFIFLWVLKPQYLHYATFCATVCSNPSARNNQKQQSAFNFAFHWFPATVAANSVTKSCVVYFRLYMCYIHAYTPYVSLFRFVYRDCDFSYNCNDSVSQPECSLF